MKTDVKSSQAGFTLIEVIVTLVIAAIMAAIVYTYFGTALTQSGVPIARLQKTSNLHQVMENISADFNRLNKINLRYKWRSNFTYSIGDVVLPSDDVDNSISKIANNGRYYVCTVAGTSGNVLPAWPVTTTTPLTGVMTESGTNRPTWRESGYVWKELTAYPANATVVPEISNGHFYRGPGGAFTTSASKPSWPTGSGSTVTEPSGPAWTEIGTIFDRTDTTDRLLHYLTTTPGRYGTGYAVVTAETKFIQFSGVSEVNAGASGTSTENNLLKVTVKNDDTAEILTQIFTIR